VVKLLAEHWWKLLLVPLLGWASYVTFGSLLAEKNREALQQLRTEQVKELKEYVDLQVGVMHGRITKVSDKVDSDIDKLTWRFFEDRLVECRENGK